MAHVVFFNMCFVLVACGYVILHFHTSVSLLVGNHLSVFRDGSSQQSCEGLHSIEGYRDKCMYLQSDHQCDSEGYIDYLYLFYCKFGRIPELCQCLLFLWLLVLFYLLANTASEYLCPSLQHLSKFLKLSPTVAGITLLSLGNGACDVFSSFASFKGSGTRGIGLNTIIGGGTFVSCVVVGVISISTRHRNAKICKFSLVRDVCFLFVVLLCLIMILGTGDISIWGAIGYSLMYVVYVVVVCVSVPFLNGVQGESEKEGHSNHDGSEFTMPILTTLEKEEDAYNEETGVTVQKKCFCNRFSSCDTSMCILNMPLYLPRRLTIPVICEERWSKPFAVSSVTLAPVLFSTLWNPYEGSDTFGPKMIVYGLGLTVGTVLGVLAFLKCDKSSPPNRFRFPWLAGGFTMSVTWSYIVAKELVGLLVSLGYISGVSPSILGLTVLAWGDSLGDLTTNLTMALKGGREGVQVAISACYAGPIFNTLVGLGLSLLRSCWLEYPSPIVLPNDPYFLESLGFYMAGLLWALVVLIKGDMRLDGVLGGGLLIIYFISVLVRLIQTIGFL